MRLSLNWLKEFVDLPITAADLADRLTLAGLEVEALEEIIPDFSGVVAARVTRVERHPQADRLQVTEVDDGSRTYQVVCGAPNVRAGRVYTFAPPGAVLAGGHKLKPAKLRGVVSEGMLLAEDELGLSQDHVGLMDIPQDLPLGVDVAAALNLADAVLEVAVTANRPDCLSMLGLAREVSALLGQPLRVPRLHLTEALEPAAELARITIDTPGHCPRYAARLLTGLTVQPSPFWLRRRLHLAGLRAINNLVDVTNYVLLEFGQPLHAFDFDRLQGGRIVVRLTRPREEKFVTLDGQERALDPESLLICDGLEPVALAGIMGGLHSEVEAGTHRVLIESAYFNPRTIRRTAKRLGLGTEASYRFERGVDPDGLILALERAAQLMAELGGGQILAGRLDVYPRPITRPRLTLRVSRTNAVLGTSFSLERVTGLLERLHLPVRAQDEDTLETEVPSFRGDLTREIDLIEEVARLAGFREIPVTLPRGVVATQRPGTEVRLRREAKQLLLGMGFGEAVTYSFQPERLWSLIALETEASALALANPLSEEQALMRTSLLPGLLDALRRNVSKQILDVRLFELSKTFLHRAGATLPTEEQHLAGVMYGERREASWLASPQSLDFFDLKGVMEALLQGLSIPRVSFRRESLPAYLQLGAQVYTGEVCLGHFGELRRDLAEKLDLPGAIWVFDLQFTGLAQVSLAFPLYEPLPRYPSVYRDVALVLADTIPAAQVAEALYRHGRPWLVEARLFDVYAGTPIPAGKRSLAFALAYRDPERTLTDDMVNRRHQEVIQALTEDLGAELR